MKLKCWLVLFGCLMSFPAAAAAPEATTWGLCIGISDYSLPELTLKWADKDAIEFSAFLRYGLNLPEDHYRILKNREATRENIRDAFGWLGLMASREDRVFIFYSGHGKDNSPIVPYNTDDLFSMETLKKALENIRAKEIIFFADACYSGKLAGKGAKRIIERESLTGLTQNTISEIGAAKPGMVIITSANGIQEAYEKDGQKNGLFTYYLMNTLMDPAMRGAIDTDRNQQVSLYEVYQNIRYAVSSESEQEPQISNEQGAQQVVLFAETAETLATAAASSAATPAPAPTPAPVEKKRMSAAAKTVIGIGAVAAIGGGIALAAGSGGGDDNDADATPTPDSGSTGNLEATLYIVPQLQTTCGNITYRLYINNKNLAPITVSRIDYEESLTLDLPSSSCKQGEHGTLLPSVTTVKAEEWKLVREWTSDMYGCGGCPYKFSECSYNLAYSVVTSLGTITATPVTFTLMYESTFCPATPTKTPTPNATPTVAATVTPTPAATVTATVTPAP